jgi:hypothetical protein
MLTKLGMYIMPWEVVLPSHFFNDQQYNDDDDDDDNNNNNMSN